MFRRVNNFTAVAVAARFNSTESSVSAPKPSVYSTTTLSGHTVVAAPPASSKKALEDRELNEFKAIAADPQGMRPLRGWKPASRDDYIYNRGSNAFPTVAEYKSRSDAEKRALGQIQSRPRLHMANRYEANVARKAAVAAKHILSPFRNVSNAAEYEGTGVHVRCTAINPLEHDMTYHGNKTFAVGQVTKALRGGTYLKL